MGVHTYINTAETYSWLICDQISKSFGQFMCEWGTRDGAHVCNSRCMRSSTCQLKCVCVLDSGAVCLARVHVSLISSRCPELEVLVSEFAVDPQYKRRVSIIPHSVHPSACTPSLTDHWPAVASHSQPGQRLNQRPKGHGKHTQIQRGQSHDQNHDLKDHKETSDWQKNWQLIRNW